MIQITVFVKKLLCLDWETKHGKADATFERGPKLDIYSPGAIVCPRCGGENTEPEVEIDLRETGMGPTAEGES